MFSSGGCGRALAAVPTCLPVRVHSARVAKSSGAGRHTRQIGKRLLKAAFTPALPLVRERAGEADFAQGAALRDRDRDRDDATASRLSGLTAMTRRILARASLGYDVSRLPQDAPRLRAPVEVALVQRPPGVVRMSLSRGLAERAIKLELQHPGHEVPAKYRRKPINSSLIRLSRQPEPPRSLMERRIECRQTLSANFFFRCFIYLINRLTRGIRKQGSASRCRDATLIFACEMRSRRDVKSAARHLYRAVSCRHVIIILIYYHRNRDVSRRWDSEDCPMISSIDPGLL